MKRVRTVNNYLGALKASIPANFPVEWKDFAYQALSETLMDATQAKLDLGIKVSDSLLPERTEKIGGKCCQ